MKDSLDSLDGAAIFTSIDLQSGYWQVEMTKASKPLTAFTVGSLGFYECVWMPFGLTNASVHIPTFNGNLFGGNTFEMVYYLPG